MTNLIIEKLLAKTKRNDLPNFVPGDTVRVHVKIKEGDKERLQAFEGVVIARTRGPQASFTVRKISFGHGVERIFPVHSRVIDKVDLVRSSQVRRAKLYYLRKLRGKDVQITHGLADSLQQLDKESPEFRTQVSDFLDELVSHYVLDEGKLVVAHAGMKEEMQGRGSGKVRDFALYGETTGETDEFGLPVRYNWAAEYRGRAMVSCAPARLVESHD